MPEPLVKILKLEAKPILKSLLADEDGVVAVRAATHLANLGDRGGLSIMEKYMFDPDIYRGDRYACLRSLEHVDGEQVIKILERWLQESELEKYKARDLLMKKGRKEWLLQKIEVGMTQKQVCHWANGAWRRYTRERAKEIGHRAEGWSFQERDVTKEVLIYQARTGGVGNNRLYYVYINDADEVEHVYVAEKE